MLSFGAGLPEITWLWTEVGRLAVVRWETAIETAAHFKTSDACRHFSVDVSGQFQSLLLFDPYYWWTLTKLISRIMAFMAFSRWWCADAMPGWEEGKLLYYRKSLACSLPRVSIWSNRCQRTKQRPKLNETNYSKKEWLFLLGFWWRRVKQTLVVSLAVLKHSKHGWRVWQL